MLNAGCPFVCQPDAVAARPQVLHGWMGMDGWMGMRGCAHVAKGGTGASA